MFKETINEKKFYFYYYLYQSIHRQHMQVQLLRMKGVYLLDQIRFQEKFLMNLVWVAIVGVRQEHLMRLHSLPCQQIIS